MDIHTNIDVSTPYDSADIELAKNIYDILDKHYSGHPWAVWADHRKTNATADILLFYPNKLGQIYKFGYKLHIAKLDAPYLRKKVIRAGGELLERYGLSRDRANEDSFLDAKSNGLDKTGRVG